MHLVVTHKIKMQQPSVTLTHTVAAGQQLTHYEITKIHACARGKSAELYQVTICIQILLQKIICQILFEQTL